MWNNNDRSNQDVKAQIKLSQIVCQSIGIVLCSFGLHTKALIASQHANEIQNN